MFINLTNPVKLAPTTSWECVPRILIIPKP